MLRSAVPTRSMSCCCSLSLPGSRGPAPATQAASGSRWGEAGRRAWQPRWYCHECRPEGWSSSNKAQCRAQPPQQQHRPRQLTLVDGRVVGLAASKLLLGAHNLQETQAGRQEQAGGGTSTSGAQGAAAAPMRASQASSTAPVQHSRGDRSSCARSWQAHLQAPGLAPCSGCRPEHSMAKVATRLPGSPQAGQRPQLGLRTTQLHLPKRGLE